MMKRACFAIIASFVVWAGSLGAQEGLPKEPFRVFDKKSGDPVEISSEKLSADLTGNKITFSGRVVVRQGSRVIYADNLEAKYEKSGELASLYGFGNVKMTAADSFAVAEKLLWDNKKQTVRLWGNPRLIQGRQIILGQEMLFYVKEDRLTIEKPQIEWLPAEGQDERKK